MAFPLKCDDYYGGWYLVLSKEASAKWGTGVRMKVTNKMYIISQLRFRLDDYQKIAMYGILLP